MREKGEGNKLYISFFLILTFLLIKLLVVTKFDKHIIYWEWNKQGKVFSILKTILKG
jgi:hypothetical protein